MLALASLAVPGPHAPAALADGVQPRTIDGSHPVINLGLPKSGSSSVADFFQCAGLRTSHHDCDVVSQIDVARRPRPGRQKKTTCGGCAERNAEAGRPLLLGCGEYDVWAQMDVDGDGGRVCFLPQVTHLSELLEQYPNALFLLPTRPADHWVASVNNWNNMHERLFQCGLPGLNLDHSSDKAQDDLLKQFYYNHTLSVREFMATQSSAFIEFDIEEKEELVGAQLAEATGLPASCWGKSNCKRSCEFWQEMEKIRQQWDHLDREPHKSEAVFG